MGLLNIIKIKLLNDSATIPQKQTENSAGYDVYSSENKIIRAKKYELISTGLSIEMASDIEAQIRPRSGLAIKNGITVLNSPGTIDSDYRGEIKIALINHSDNDFEITTGQRIAQIIFSKVENVKFDIVEQLSNTTRGTGGFGSTGIE